MGRVATYAHVYTRPCKSTHACSPVLHVCTRDAGAGKSIYVKSLSLIAVLAQIGCFVPAESASLPIFDRILTSLGTGDDMVCVCV